MKKRSSLLLALFFVLGATGTAHAGGYDTPILYSARHMGLGGAAASYVRDPSAMFHNPAGLANIRQGSVLINVSPVFGGIKSKPDALSPDNTESETTFAPFFLVGGAYRITDWLVAGLAVYPVASAGAEYKYSVAGMKVENRTRLMFLEASPGLAVNLPGNINLGAGYRVTYVDLERVQKLGGTAVHDFQMSGLNWLGFRVGAQWNGVFGDHKLKLGAQYRHKTVTEIENDDGTAAYFPFTDISTKFILPTRFVGGARYDVADFGATVDVEYALNSQNDGYPLKGTDPNGVDREVPNPSKWTNGTTVRSGLEYRLVDGHVPLRVGYIWDQKTSNPKYPSAFGTPPGASHIVTCGSGYNAGPWEVNGAVAYRTAQGEVTPVSSAECPFCGGANPDPYELWMVGAYIDFSYEWQ